MTASFKACSAFALLAIASLVSTPVTLAQDRFSVAGDRVALYNLAGEIRIERGTGSNVVVEIQRLGDDGGRLDVQRSEQNGWQMIVVRYPADAIVYRGRGRWGRSDFSVDRDGTFGLRNLDPDLGPERVTAKADAGRRDRRVRIRGSGRGLEAHADVRIMVPAGKAVAVHLGVGKVSVNEVAADIQVDTRSGSVSARAAEGFLRIDTGSGGIDVNGAAGDVALNTGSGGVRARRIDRGLLKIHTGSGSVELSGVNAPELRVSTGSGGVTVADVQAPMLSVSTGSGGIRARSINSSKFDLGTGSGSINLELLGDVDMGRVHTGSGGVTITTSSRLGADVTLDTGSGGIDVDIPMDVVERKRSFLRARIGDGRGSLLVNTGSGGIALR